MQKFLVVCLGEIKKQRVNYYNSWSNFISLLVWPILVYLTTYYIYFSFDIGQLTRYGITSKKDLLIFLVIGALGYNSFFAMVQGAFQIINERENGTLEIIYLTPASRMAMLYGRALGGFFQSVWQFSLFFLVIVVYGCNMSLRKIGLILVSYFLLIIASTIWGGFINALFIITRDANFIFSLCDEPMNLFCGVKIPIASFPLFARIISAIFPLTYCLIIMRSLILVSDRYNVLNSFIRLMISFIILIFATIAIVKLSEKHNRKTGNLQLY